MWTQTQELSLPPPRTTPNEVTPALALPCPAMNSGPPPQRPAPEGRRYPPWDIPSGCCFFKGPWTRGVRGSKSKKSLGDYFWS